MPKGYEVRTVQQGTVFADYGAGRPPFPSIVDRLTSKFVVCRCTGRDITILIDDYRCALFPARAVTGYPCPCRPFTDVVAARQYA